MGAPRRSTYQGWNFLRYRAARSGPRCSSARSITQSKTRTRVKLDTGGKRYRYYLVWITKLPPQGSSVSIAEIRLFRLGTS